VAIATSRHLTQPFCYTRITFLHLAYASSHYAVIVNILLDFDLVTLVSSHQAASAIDATLIYAKAAMLKERELERYICYSSWVFLQPCCNRKSYFGGLRLLLGAATSLERLCAAKLILL